MLCILVGVVLVLGLNLVPGSSSTCNFPAIYNFGDSNSDTGAHSAAFVQIPSPYGETNLGDPPKRLSNGHLILDFITEKLGLPYVNAYLDAIDSDFQQGANFATAGSSILPGPYSPFDLRVQISQFIEFKSRTAELYKKSRDSETCGTNIPNPNDFSKALYTFDIGQNDLTFGFENMTVDQLVKMIPNILDRFDEAIQQLYGEGARTFWIHNTGPIGCIPLLVLQYKSRNGTLDQYGCVGYQNTVVQQFNQQLQQRVSQLRNNFSEGAFIYVDVYAAKFALISNAKSEGFADPLNYCCGTFMPTFVMCGLSAQVNGTIVNGTACADPWDRISWDGIHYTDAANSWIASRILNGSESNPPVPIYEACA